MERTFSLLSARNKEGGCDWRQRRRREDGDVWPAYTYPGSLTFLPSSSSMSSDRHYK